VLKLNGRRAWIFHGDVFDVTMKYSKWLAKLGAIGYDALIIINSIVNWVLYKFGKEKISLSKRVKDSVKTAVKFINDFERIAADIAIENGYDYVICGHIHHPEIKEVQTSKGHVKYLNSGDWVENLTSLEYNNGQWKIYRYNDDRKAQAVKLPKRLITKLDNNQIFNDLVNEFIKIKK
jgi:UDP-2,3-diacylglucosamine pyrophosphatase LpxH